MHALNLKQFQDHCENKQLLNITKINFYSLSNENLFCKFLLYCINNRIIFVHGGTVEVYIIRLTRKQKSE